LKLDVAWTDDGVCHEYCWFCRAEALEAVRTDDRMYYGCHQCGGVYPRRLVIDPEIVWWVAEDGEYWHESAGVFVRNPQGKFLFFERTKFPFGLTVPAGHRNAGEDPSTTGVRELNEEVGLQVTGLTWISTDDIWGDACGRGADVHRWHAFGIRLRRNVRVQVQEEGDRPVWLSLEQALRSELTPAMRFVITRQAEGLSRL
jgi:8-oxo-dGTP pyrophosphatase MutT (NUDIX family)